MDKMLSDPVGFGERWLDKVRWIAPSLETGSPDAFPAKIKKGGSIWSNSVKSSQTAVDRWPGTDWRRLPGRHRLASIFQFLLYYRYVHNNYDDNSSCEMLSTGKFRGPTISGAFSAALAVSRAKPLKQGVNETPGGFLHLLSPAEFKRWVFRSITPFPAGLTRTSIALNSRDLCKRLRTF